MTHEAAPICVPQRVRQALLPGRRPLRPAHPAARPPPGRLPGHDPAVSARLVGGHHRRAAGLRPAHGATLGASLQPPGRPQPCRPAPSGPTRLGSRRLGDRIRRLLAGPRAWTISRLWQRLGRPAISQRTLRRRARDVAAWRRPRLTAKNHRMPISSSPVSARPLPSLPEGLVVLAEDATHINHPGSPHRASTHTRPTTPRRHGRDSHHRHPQRQPPQHTSKGRVDPYGGRLLPVCCPTPNPGLRDHNLDRPLASSQLLSAELLITGQSLSWQRSGGISPMYHVPKEG
jgi:hypothetical protein